MEQGSELIAGGKTGAITATSTQRPYARYLFITIAAVFLLLATPLIALSQAWYPRFSNYFYDPVIDYKAALHGRAEDILVYGDSSALHNVVPATVQGRIGEKIYNLGFTASIVGGAPDLMLDRYLAQNALPHVIVLYIAPPTIVNGYQIDTGHFYEAAMALQRYAPLKQSLAFYAGNPRRAFAIAAVVFRNLLGPPEPVEKNYRDVTATMSAQSGWTPTPDLFRNGGVGLLPVQNNQPRAKFAADSRYIQDFKRKYETLGAKVLVYVSPISTCSDLALDDIKAAYKPLADNEPYVFPCEDFRGAFHLTEEAARENSERVATFLAEKLNLKQAARQ